MDDRPGFWSDKVLSAVETITVILLAAGIYSVVIYEVYWIWFGAEATRSARLEAVAKTLNENWKTGLILFVPLFYRTIRQFLERVEKFAGMEARRPETEKAAPIPPERSPQANEEG